MRSRLDALGRGAVLHRWSCCRTDHAQAEGHKSDGQDKGFTGCGGGLHTRRVGRPSRGCRAL